MTFYRIFERASFTIIEYVEDWIRTTYASYGPKALSLRGMRNIHKKYIDTFMSEYGDYINKTMIDKLWFAAQNTECMILMYMHGTPTFDLEQLIAYVKRFMIFQLINPDTWVSDIPRIPEEELERILIAGGGLEETPHAPEPPPPTPDGPR